MKREEIFKIVAQMINEINENNVQDIREESNLVKDLRLDSINLVNLQVLIEDEFHIYFNSMDDDMTETLESVHSLIDKIEDKIRQE